MTQRIKSVRYDIIWQSLDLEYLVNQKLNTADPDRDDSFNDWVSSCEHWQLVMQENHNLTKVEKAIVQSLWAKYYELIAS